jgi:hypothetical protein
MNHIAINKSLVSGRGSGIASHPEMVLLGGHAPVVNQTRVMAANFGSRNVTPADLDAFLQGHFQSF